MAAVRPHGGAQPDRRVAARAADLEHLAARPAGAEREEEGAARRRDLERALVVREDGVVVVAIGLLLEPAENRTDAVVEHQAVRSRSTSARTQQSARWSFTTPHACMAA